MNLSSPDRPVLDYAEKPARISRFAVAAMIVSLIGALTFFLLAPSVVGLILGIVACSRVNRHPRELGGKGFAVAATTISLCTICFSLAIFMFLPSMCSRERPARAYCAANLRGIVQSMIVYSNENNDAYPVVTYAAYSPVLNSPSAAATESTADDALKSYYKKGHPQAGSVAASLWMLVLRNQTSPKQFICKSDPTATTVAQLIDGPNFYDNFQNDTQISYSAAYPWKADGTVGKWWTNTTDSSLPIMADMAPENGTGTPRRDLLSATAPPRARNSANHGGDGQNVAFADCHVEFTRRPDIGQGDDCIWTSSGAPSLGPAPFGGVPATRSSPTLTRDAPPFDTVMFPIRNLDTGRL